MNLSTLRRWLLAAVVGLATMTGAKAEQASPVTVIRDGDNITAMLGNLVVSKYNEATGEGSQYFYISGLIWQAAYSDGTVNHYFYDADGKLLRIETRKYVRANNGDLQPTSMAGITQQAIYAGNKLVALASSTGKRLEMDPRLAQRGDLALHIKAPKSKAMRLTPLSAAERKASFNHRMLAIKNWENRPANWECTLTPEGEQICIGRGPGEDGGGGGAPYDPGPRPHDPPPDDGGGRGGGGGGGGEGGNHPVDYQALNSPIAPNLPTRESCFQAAINTYWVMMNQVCKIPKDRSRCEWQALVIYQEHERDCMATYPG